MRKILGSLFVISALLAVGVFATGAYFSAGPYGSSMTITSGTASIQIDPISGLPLTTTNLAPGWSADVCVKVSNDGSTPLGHVTLTVNSVGDVGLWDALTLAVSAGGGCGIGAPVASGTLHQFQGNIYQLGALAPGGSVYVTQTIAFPDTGVPQNGLQGKSIDVAEMFYGQQ